MSRLSTPAAATLSRLAPTSTERTLSKMLVNSRDIISLVDRDGTVLFTTADEVGALGYDDARWAGLNALGLAHPDDRERIEAAWREVISRPGAVVDDEIRMQQADGSWADVMVTGVNLLDDSDVRGIVLTARNVSDLRQAERTTRRQAGVLELIAIGAAPETVFERCLRLIDLPADSTAAVCIDGRTVSRIGNRGRPLIGRSAAAALEAQLVDTLHEDDDQRDGPAPSLQYRAEPVEGVGSAWAIAIPVAGESHRTGAIVVTQPSDRLPTEAELDAAERSASLVGIAIERMEVEERLADQARRDSLTGLPNRTLLLVRLGQAIHDHHNFGETSTVLFCDLDRFKVVNDSLGHGIGDQLLIAVAERITSVVGPQMVARFGGDEFVILLVGADAEPEDSLKIAKAVTEALTRPFELSGGQDVYLTTSVGLAHVEGHLTADEWLRDADAAMYRAKEAGRNGVASFDQEMRDAAIARLQVEHDLQRGVERSELVVHYLPTVDLSTGRICGAEALVRWNHPTRGLLGPDEFVPVAEETGVIDDVGEFVLDVATREMAALLAERPIGRFQLGVNVSARQVSSPGLPDRVATTCDRNGWPLEHLLLEITETALTRDGGHPEADFGRATAMGIQFAIDDFGTGHSSLTRLQQLPVDQLKIDRSFVSEIGRTDARRQMVEAVIALAGALGLATCAEGIETVEQLEHLRSLGCQQTQGFLFSRPVDAAGLAALIDAGHRW